MVMELPVRGAEITADWGDDNREVTINAKRPARITLINDRGKEMAEHECLAQLNFATPLEVLCSCVMIHPLHLELETTRLNI